MTKNAQELFETVFDMQREMRPVEILVNGSRLSIAQHAIREAAYDYVGGLPVKITRKAIHSDTSIWDPREEVTGVMDTGDIGTGQLETTITVKERVGAAAAYVDETIRRELRGKLMYSPEFKEWFTKELIQW